MPFTSYFYYDRVLTYISSPERRSTTHTTHHGDGFLLFSVVLVVLAREQSLEKLGMATHFLPGSYIIETSVAYRRLREVSQFSTHQLHSLGVLFTRSFC